MEIKDPLKKILNQIYEPHSMVEKPFKKYYAAFKTDENGRPVLLFLGERTTEGKIIGERYTRRLKIDKDGKVLKDHWERKGKAS